MLERFIVGIQKIFDAEIRIKQIRSIQNGNNQTDSRIYLCHGITKFNH